MKRADSFGGSIVLQATLRPRYSAAIAILAITICVSVAAWGSEESPSVAPKPSNELHKPIAPTVAWAKAEQLSRDALYFEIAGDAAKREQSLAEARAICPDYPIANWHSGLVRDRSGWKSIEDWNESMAADARLSTYANHRDKWPDTALGNLRLANWCAAHRLGEQARAHFSRVLEFDPNNAQAHIQLGDVRVDGRWIAVRCRSSTRN